MYGDHGGECRCFNLNFTFDQIVLKGCFSSEQNIFEWGGGRDQCNHAI